MFAGSAVSPIGVCYLLFCVHDLYTFPYTPMQKRPLRPPGTRDCPKQCLRGPHAYRNEIKMLLGS